MATLSIQGSELEYFNELLMQRKERVHEYLASETYKTRIQPSHIYDGAYIYIKRTGKALRLAYYGVVGR
jgi:hypothetical protein